MFSFSHQILKFPSYQREKKGQVSQDPMDIAKFIFPDLGSTPYMEADNLLFTGDFNYLMMCVCVYNIYNFSPYVQMSHLYLELSKRPNGFPLESHIYSQQRK